MTNQRPMNQNPFACLLILIPSFAFSRDLVKGSSLYPHLISDISFSLCNIERMVDHCGNRSGMGNKAAIVIIVSVPEQFKTAPILLSEWTSWKTG